MKYGLTLFLSCLAMPVLASPEWLFEDAKTAENVAFDVRADKVRVVVPEPLFATGELPSSLSLPLTDGRIITFSLHPNTLLPPALALRYPAIKTYSGSAAEDPQSSGRFDLTPQGFHGMFTYRGKTFYIDPLFDGTSYAVYTQQESWRRLDEDEVLSPQLGDLTARSVLVSGNQRKRYTIAISATGEYTRYHGGTKADALAAIATMLNRINEVYRRDVGAEFQLAADTDKVIFTDPATDPFTNSTQDLTINQTQQALLLAPGFDIGHLLTTSGGGLATLGALCNPASRSQGMTGSPQPTGDAFYIDYVAHELGHQMGAEHSFNGTSGSCGSGREASSAWEPGSGSSIMAYAGICGEEDLQSNSVPFFHSKSIEQIRTKMASLPSCGTNLALSNNAPVVDAGVDRVIPANTVFTLSGSAVDLDGNPLSYSWEELDLGSASTGAATMVDDGSRPLFRMLSPTQVPSRSLPAMSSLISGVLAKGEAWPTTSRNLHFRLAVRDGQGAVSSDETVVQVVNTGAVFAIKAPLAGNMVAGATQTLNWDVAGTNQAPINCQNVDVALTQDSGSHWTTLVAGIPNSGSTSITLPNPLARGALLRLACSDNIFFTINTAERATATPGSSTGSTVIGGSGGGGGGGSVDPLWLVMLAGGAIWRRRCV
ncbi:reprolysin-like metallopeptidase [Aeromonas sp. MdU4]|uniref:reprolysin-like metallopeptidase n=1 Tax=Aeromonas sp. MdU4 TaxID=3342819 RepID=UPI0035B73E4D